MDANVAFNDAVARARQIAAKLSAGAPAGGLGMSAMPPGIADKPGNPNMMPLGMKRSMDDGPGGPDIKRFAPESDAIGSQLRAMADQQRNEAASSAAARAAAAAAAQVAAKLNRGGGSDGGQKSQMASPMPAASTLPPGFPITENYSIPDRMVGLVIGKGGEQISRLQMDSGCKIQIAPDSGGRPDRPCTLTGSPECVDKAKRLIGDIIRKAQVAGTVETVPDGHTLVEMFVPGTKVGLVIGKGGETIKMLQEQTGCRLVMVQDSSMPSDMDKPLRITGSPENVEEARRMVQELLDSKDVFPPGQAGGAFSEYGTQRPGVQQSSVEELQRKPIVGGGGELIMVPKPCVGVVIGKGGDMIKRLETDFNVRIQFRPDDGTHERACQVTGPAENVYKAMAAIQQICDDSARADGLRRRGRPEMGRGPLGGLPGMGGGAVRPGMQGSPFGDGFQESTTMPVPADKCGIVIGKGGENIREICRITGAHAELQRQPSANPAEKVFDIRGTPEQIQHAMSLIAEKAGMPPPGSHPPAHGGLGGHGMPHGGPGGWGPPGAGPAGPQPWGGAPGYGGGAPPAPQPAWGGAGYGYGQWGSGGGSQAEPSHDPWQAYYAQYYQQPAPGSGSAPGQMPVQQQQQQQPPQHPQMQPHPPQPQPLPPQQPVQPVQQMSMPQQQQQQPQHQPQQSAQSSMPGASINPVTGQPDYSEAWAAYYRQMGLHDQADAILAQARQSAAGSGGGQQQTQGIPGAQ